jgi:hypothetical protein
LHVTCYLFILHVTCYLLMLKGFLGKVEKNYNFFYTRIFHKMNKYYFLHQEKYKRWKCKNKMCRSFLWLLWATYISTFQNQKFVIENVLNVQYSTVQYSTAQHSTVQYSTVQYSTVQYSTVQYSTVQTHAQLTNKTCHIFFKTLLSTLHSIHN